MGHNPSHLTKGLLRGVRENVWLLTPLLLTIRLTSYIMLFLKSRELVRNFEKQFALKGLGPSRRNAGPEAGVLPLGRLSSEEWSETVSLCVGRNLSGFQTGQIAAGCFLSFIMTATCPPVCTQTPSRPTSVSWHCSPLATFGHLTSATA